MAKTNFQEKDTNSNDVTTFALAKINYLLIAISFVVIIIGFVLMGGESSTPEHYNPDIFSWRRIVLGPTIAFLGFVAIVFAIMYRGKAKGGNN